LSLDDLADSQGELAISIEHDSNTNKLLIAACATLPSNPKPADIAAAYLSLCDTSEPQLFNFFHSITDIIDRDKPRPRPAVQEYTILNAKTLLAIYAGKKYKPVALKI
jgi:hypothetical protein